MSATQFLAGGNNSYLPSIIFPSVDFYGDMLSKLQIVTN